MAIMLINHIYEMEPQEKGPKQQNSKSFQFGEHIRVLGEWYAQTGHEGYAHIPSPSTLPCPFLLFDYR